MQADAGLVSQPQRHDVVGKHIGMVIQFAVGQLPAAVPDRAPVRRPVRLCLAHRTRPLSPHRPLARGNTPSQDLQEAKHGDAAFIPHGTNLPEPRPAKKIPQLGLTPNKYVLFVGRLVPEKGVHYLCEAFSQIDTDMTLALVGGLSFSQGYVDILKKYESDRIRLLDYVFGESLEELWSNAYCVVQPSTMEGLSIALLEALSYGRCVLISDIPENMEVAEECSMNFKSKDVPDLKAKLERLIREPELVRSFGDRARHHILQHYSWDNVAESTAQLYRQLVVRK